MTKTSLDPTFAAYRIQELKAMLLHEDPWTAIKARFNISRQRVYQILQYENGYQGCRRMAMLSRMNTLYTFIVDYKLHHNGNSPTIAEMRDGLYLGSLYRVVYLLHQLVKERKIVMSGTRQTRSIEVIGSRWIPPEQTIERSIL
jgi:hypothetical protein